MKYIFLILIPALMTSCLSKLDVDLIVHNAIIYTVDESFTVHEAMAIIGDSIVELGPEHQILNKYNAAKTIDAKMQYVYPGFIDAHCHFIGYAKSLNQLNLLNCKSQEELAERIYNFSSQEKGNWILGRGWDQNLWADKSYPDMQILDNLDSSVFVIVKRVDGHAALVNQKVLDLVGIDANTVIEGGKIEVKNGQCTGILIDNAVDLVTALIPEYTDEELKSLVSKAQSNCFEKGLTTLSDAGLDLNMVRLLQQWKKEGLLKMKLYIMLNPSQENFAEFLPGGPVQSRDISIRSFKLYADGALGSRGANLISPYSDDEDGNNFGLLLTPQDSLKDIAQKLFEAGFQMNTHAIGDRANKVIANIYAEVLGGSNDRRWRIEHCQVVQKEDLKTFKDFNIIPSVQPTHATSDMSWAIDRLGEERINYAYAYRSLKEQNGMLALGTDFPVEKIDPLLTILAAVNRTDLSGNPKGGYHMEESLSFDDCLRGMTIWAAIANFEEKDKGSLEVGKNADFILINKDLKHLEASNFNDYQVLQTYVNGELVYQKNE